MKLKRVRDIGKEIIHFAEGETQITSLGRHIYFKTKDGEHKVTLPEQKPFKRILENFRIFRRVLRLDKCNVFLHDGNLIIIRQGFVYFYDTQNDALSLTLQLRNCRNVLHQSICATPDGNIFFGEYGANKERKSVPVYRSSDGGKSWEEIYTFAPGSIKHIHGCFYDKYSDKVWVCTGDFKDENWLVVADSSFEKVEKIGDGQQRFRACNLIFKEDKVHWLMDSQLEPSYHIIYDRQKKDITVGQKMMGPIWYIKKLSEDFYLAASAQEIGDGVLDDKVHLYYSTDLDKWHTLSLFHHDGLPKGYFKNGVIGFADGQQSTESFYMFFEAIKGLDGKAIEYKIETLPSPKD